MKRTDTNKNISFVCLLLIFFVGLSHNVLSKGLMVPLLPVDADKMVIFPDENIDGWNSDFALVDTSWTLCAGEPGGVGFDNEGDYAKFISLDLSTMENRQTTCYIRAKFALSADIRQELDYMSIGIRFDDGYIAYLNGEVVASANAPQNPNRRSNASQPHEAQSMVWFDISEHVDKLQDGNNLFAIHGMNVTGTSPDFLIQFELVARKNYERNFVSDLPIVIINSDNNLPVNQNTIRNGSIGIINNGPGSEHKLTDTSNDFSGRLAITRDANIYDYPKNHYYLTLQDDAGAETSASLLGQPEGDAWILYAPYNDKTLIRSALMGELSVNMGHSFSSRMCHLFLNEDYLGLYCLMAKPDRHVNSINISELTPEDIDGDAVTGGYILELDEERSRPGFDSPTEPFRNAPDPLRYLYAYPTASDISEPQRDYIQSFMNTFETDVFSSIDLASAVDYFLLNEVAKNVDAYRNNIILYKDRDSINPRMFVASPVDYNNACGNNTAYEGNLVKGWQLSYLSEPANVSSDSMFVPFWWQQLFDDTIFINPLYERWHELKDNVLSEDFVLHKLDSLYSVLENDRILNFERWPVSDKPIEPYGYVGETFDDDYDYLYVWMIDRLEWMNQAMEEFETSVTSNGIVTSSYALDQNYPNPFNPSTTISYQVPRASFVKLQIFDVRGVLIDELVNENQAAGHYDVHWQSDSRPSGVYFYQLKAGEFLETRRMLLIR